MSRGYEQTFFQRRHTDDQHIHKKMLNITSHQGNANQNHSFTFVRKAIIKKTRNNKCWQECGEKECVCSAGGSINWCSHYGKQNGAPSKN